MADWTAVISLVATLSGVVTAAGAAWAAARTTRRQQQDLQRLTIDVETRALDSSNLQTLGKYLVDDIGEVRVSDVVSDDLVRQRTLQAFSRVAQFVGERPTEPGERAAAPTSSEHLSSEELNRARQQILAGDVWNGLALMRRHLEIVLRETSPSLRASRMSAGQLVSASAKTGTLSEDFVPQLRYALNVANRAIHGEEVDVGAALEAVDSADYGLSGVRRVQDEPTRRDE